MIGSSPHTPDTGRQLWLAGLPCVGERRLSTEEYSRFQQEQSKLSLWSVVGCCAFFPLFICLLVMGSLIPNNSSGLTSFFAVALVLFIVVIPSVVLLKASDWQKQAKARAHIWRDGRILIFEGHVDQVLYVELLNIAPRDGHLLKVEAFPSGEVLTVNGIKPNTFLQYEVVAAGPRQVINTTAPVNSSTSDAFSSRVGERRNLTSEEIDEIRRMCRKIPLKSSIPAIFLTLFLGLSLGSVLWLGGKLKIEPTAPLFIAAWAYSVYRLVYNVRMARSMLADVATGYVVKEQVAQNDFIIERLPGSGTEWTVNGNPAPWRLQQSNMK